MIMNEPEYSGLTSRLDAALNQHGISMAQESEQVWSMTQKPVDFNHIIIVSFIRSSYS